MKRLLLAVFVSLLLFSIYGHALSMDKEALLQKAENGNSDSQAMLGLIYSGGLGTPRDDAQSVLWFRKAAAQGNAVAQNNLGRDYEEGRGVSKDVVQAVEWYRKAAEQDYMLARVRLETMFIRGQIVPKLDDHSGDWWRKLAERSQKETKQFSVLRKAANSGSAVDQINLGIAYLTGVGTLKDRGQATALFRKATDQGQAEAKCLLANIIASDSDWKEPSNNIQAAEFCRKAADDGFADAQFLLGVLYRMGRSIPVDKVQATKWIHKAADQGRPDAQFMLGLSYDLGNGVEKDEKQANIWYQKAADKGNPDAMESINLQRMVSTLTANSDNKIKQQNAEYSNLALEHSPDKERDLLANLRASAAQQEHEKQMAGGFLHVMGTVIDKMQGK